ncbi:MAG: HD domain-containing protein [Thioalkalivibrionaceae bacterium]
MQWFCVGGAVRDRWLGRAVTDRDFVVVGATPEMLERAGFHAVGRDFPVFLHPITGEECALARTERKQGRGYRGFTVHAAPSTTLEDDLQRRDLTINALAQPVANDPLHAAPEVAWDAPTIDPFDGIADLKAKRLRHVSKAFVEDPVRLLRLARFAAQLANTPTRIDYLDAPDRARVTRPTTAGAGRRALYSLAIGSVLAPDDPGADTHVDRIDTHNVDRIDTHMDPQTGNSESRTGVNQHGFTVAPETLDLARRMVAAGELDHLVPERVWAELEKALKATDPVRFIAVLQATEALSVILPEVDALFGVPQPPRYHPEIDTGVHTALVLAAATAITTDPMVRFAALTHDLGKADTPAECLPSHPGHEQAGVKRISALCTRLRVPAAYRDLALLVAAHHGHIHRIFDLAPDTIVELFDALDLQRKPERLEPFLLAVEADFRGRTGFENRPYPQADLARELASCYLGIRADAELLANHSGAAIGGALRERRIHAIAAEIG